MQAVRSKASAALGMLPGIVQPFYYFPIRLSCGVLQEYFAHGVGLGLVDNKVSVFDVIPEWRRSAGIVNGGNNMTLYEIDRSIEALVNAVDPETGEITVDNDALDALMMERDNKIEKLLTINGDADQFDEVMKRKADGEALRFELTE